jgi:hypothetical protein
MELFFSHRAQPAEVFGCSPRAVPRVVRDARERCGKKCADGTIHDVPSTFRREG